MYESSVLDISEITFRNNYSIFQTQTNSLDIPISEIDSLTFSTEAATSNSDIVYIIYNGSNVSIINPFADAGVNVVANEGHVSVISTSSVGNIQYHLSGTSDVGSLTISSSKAIVLALSNIQLANPSGAAISITSAVDAAVKIAESSNNILVDVAGGSQSAALVSKGNITFSGSGTLTVTGLTKHAVSSSKSILVESGTIKVAGAVTDGFHSEGFTMNDGNLDIAASGDAIDAGAAEVLIQGGTIIITSTVNDVKGMKTDENLTITGGAINMSISGAQSKGLSSKKDITINGGDVTILASGATVLESSGSGYDPSYCSAVKADGNIYINGGKTNITLPSSNNGGKGLSADANIEIYDGEITVSTAGAGTTYTNASGTKDSYTSCCIKSDANIKLMGGNITCSSSGSGGKGISADGTLTIGEESAANDKLILNVTTTGSRFTVSTSTGGGGGWGQPGGNQNNTDYANPKAIKCEGNMTVNSGTITVNCSNDGGEGLESKSTLTINGGDIQITTYDDCINASSHIQINDGNMYCVAKGNDAIDSNGTITIAGGFIIAQGTGTPEGAFDCDNNTFKITGGTIIGTGGSSSSPSSSSTQYSIKYSGTSGTAICIKNSSGNTILLYKMPTYSSASGSSMEFFFSDPQLKGNTFTFYYGGTITGGTTVNGYNTGGSYSGNSSKSVTVSSVTTTVR